MIEKLLKYKCVVEEKSFSKAAIRLNTTQPALSVEIKTLEKFLTVQLLVRKKDGVFPTKAGEIVYRYSQQFSQNWQDLKKELQENFTGENIKIKLGLIDSVADFFIKNVYPELLRGGRGADVDIEVDRSRNLLQELREGDVEIAVVVRPASHLYKGLEVKAAFTETMALCCHAELAGKIESYNDLYNYQVITYDRNSHSFLQIVKQLAVHKEHLEYHNVSSPHLIVEMTKLKMGVGLLPKSELSKYGNDELVVLDLGQNLSRELIVVSRIGKYTSVLEKLIIDRLSQMYSPG